LKHYTASIDNLQGSFIEIDDAALPKDWVSNKRKKFSGNYAG
jgi:hypothetical protein